MLSGKQKKVAQAVYEGALSDEEISRQCRVSTTRLLQWYQDQEFRAELDRLCDIAGLRTRCLIANYAMHAAARLIALLDADKEDVARRAALDLVDRSVRISEQSGRSHDGDAEGRAEVESLGEEQAREMLLTLAEGFRQDGQGKAANRDK